VLKRLLPGIVLTGGFATLLAIGSVRAADEGEEAEAPPTPQTYSVRYEARIVPSQRSAEVTLRIGNGRYDVRSIRFRVDPARHRDFSGNGVVSVGPDYVDWRPPDGVGRLSYVFHIDQLRNERAYDARCAEDWALFRGDDLVPPARVRVRAGSVSRSRLRLRLPTGWSAATPYPRESDGLYRIEHADRSFDRPTGWIVVADRLGVVREKVAGVQVAVAGPAGHGLRRLDLLALLRWTLPELRDIVPALPERILVAGAGDPMWRGGLSGPNSLFIHADRPLISNDGSSPLLHELMHTALRLKSGKGGDWIVEGLAEFYSLQLLRRSRTVSRRRTSKTLERMEDRGGRVRSVRVDRAAGADVARAVTVLAALDGEIRERTDDLLSLDDVVVDLVRRQDKLTNATFQAAAERAAGGSLEDFFEREAPK
jgi:hypothetical protein